MRVSPEEGGSLIGGAELSFDAENGVPLRGAVYSSSSSAPVIELAASEVSYGAVPDSVFAVTPPSSAKVEEIEPPRAGSSSGSGSGSSRKGTAEADLPRPRHHLDRGARSKGGLAQRSSSTVEGLPKVKINGASASELRTALGTVLTFERAGVRYVVAGALPAGCDRGARAGPVA